MSTATGKGSGSGTPPSPGATERRTLPRVPLVAELRCRYESVLDFVETQSRNVSRTGMFIATDTPADVGHAITFEFTLADGFTLLRGDAEVVRVVTAGPLNGMGVKFVRLEEPMRRLIERIVAVNEDEGRNSTVNFDFSSPIPKPTASPTKTAAYRAPSSPNKVAVATPDLIRLAGSALRIVLCAETAYHFTSNPLLNVRLGGFFVPLDTDCVLGTVLDVSIVSPDGQVIVAGKGKVVAKQDLRAGVRLADADKDGLARLRAEVTKLTAGK